MEGYSIRKIVCWSILVFIVFWALVFLGVNINRYIQEHSHAYMDSKVSQLVAEYNNYFVLETKKEEHKHDATLVQSYTAQQKALKLRMCLAYNQIPNDVRSSKTPGYIKEFLSDCQ